MQFVIRAKQFCTWAEFYRLVRFSIAGGATNLLYLWLYWQLITRYGMGVVPASFLASIVHMGLKFVVQRFWTFKYLNLDRAKLELGQYAAMEVANLGINTALVYWLVDCLHFGKMEGQLIALALLAVESYVLTRWIFRFGVLAKVPSS